MESSAPLPEQFGRYRIIQRLGRGGMGCVYLAEDTQLGRRVALKVPDFGPELESEAQRRFVDEARTAATLDDPCLCPVYDVGEIDGRLYLTMAYVEGQSLAALIEEGGWPSRRVAELVGRLAAAMQKSHAHKVIHRDLKPANIMIKTAGGRLDPVIVDFGLARRDDPSQARLTRTGQVMGTTHYMAPEQLRGDAVEIGPACDIYALGVITYELLTGRLPFSGSGLAVVGQILTQQPLPPSTLQGEIDPILEQVCLKAMAKQVGDRYSSMAELAAALDEYLQGRSSMVTPPARNESDSEPLKDPSSAARRLPSTWITASTALGAIVLGVILSVAHFRNAIHTPIAPEVARFQGEPALGSAGVASKTKGISLESAPRSGATDSLPSVTNSLGMKLVLIPAGEFLMGTPGAEKPASDDESPQHRVRITRPFYLGATEVTVGQFARVVAATGFRTQAEKEGTGGEAFNKAKGKFKQDPKFSWHYPGFVQTDEDPVTNVSWNDAIGFCNALSTMERLKPYYQVGAPVPKGGDGFRLPTEAEWEYACRAGSTTRYHFGDNLELIGDHAWYFGSSAGRAHRVAQWQPNAFGLHDMHGNVSEWCWDVYDRHYYASSPVIDPSGPSPAFERVYRGGSWHSHAREVRAAIRNSQTPGFRRSILGFRVARSLKP